MKATLERLRRRREEEGREGGFTLIELLIVIVILAILAAIVVFAVQNLTGQSAIAACRSDYKTVEVAAETYKAQTSVYPGGTLPGGDTATASTETTDTSTGIKDLLGTVALADGTTVGPWLKDVPYNPNHYQIQMNGTGDGVITVWTTAATPTQIEGKGDTAPSNSIQDCTGVS
jgi:prepilin-type N-terminal cleavage/methylation domain-containing protein